MKTRLFIGNLPSTVTDGDLREKFEGLLSSHKNDAEVGEVEVRCKNENNYFGYVDILLKNGVSQDEGPQSNNRMPLFLRKYVDLMNNTKWKGSLIKVQPAKESFMDKLRKERDSRGPSNDFHSHHTNRNDHFSQNRNHSRENDSEQSRNSRQANDILYKLNKSMARKGRESKPTNETFDGDCGFEIVDHTKTKNSVANTTGSPAKNLKKRKKSSKRASSSSDDDSGDDDIRDGIPKFKGLLACYPDGPPPPLAVSKEADSSERKDQEEEDAEEDDTAIQKKLLSIAFDGDNKGRDKTSNWDRRTTKQEPNLLPATRTPIGTQSKINTASSSTGINFKKSKQQKSDMLRLQSFEKLKELKVQQSNVIKSALSSVTATPVASENRKEITDGNEDEMEVEETRSKKSKMTLFNESDSSSDEEMENNDSTFNVRRQFEGEHGQKLLEMQSRWGSDTRFKIDDRFKDSDNEDNDKEEEVIEKEKEKEKQFSILTDILGKIVTTSTGKQTAKTKGDQKTKDTFSSVILPRYDPEADGGAVDRDPVNSTEQNKDSPTKSKKKREKDSKQGESETQNDKPTPTPIRSTEPATFKTVSNLKALFSSSGDAEKGSEEAVKFSVKESAPQSSATFSLLATYGKAEDRDHEEDPVTFTKKSSSSLSTAPRNFWESNPFKYDSSDDEGETKKRKDTVKVTPSADKEESSSLIIHGKAAFFFSNNDPRFDGLEDYFLKDETELSASATDKDAEKDGEKKVEDFSIKRQELKAIVKAKIRNTKRKDEKRTLAIKRAIRKRKRKVFHKSKINK